MSIAAIENADFSADLTMTADVSSTGEMVGHGDFSADAAAFAPSPDADSPDTDDMDPDITTSVPVSLSSVMKNDAAATAQKPPHSPVPLSSANETNQVTASLSLPALDQAREHILDYLKPKGGTTVLDTAKLRVVLNDYDALKDKVSKLKSLLGRSAKAQREAKVDLDATQKRLDQALREIERLNSKIDKLASRPTHLELLADFESNFDRALLSVGQQQNSHTQTQHPYNQQPGGEDTASSNIGGTEESALVDNLLMQELKESKQRIEKLEKLYSGLTHRSSALELELNERKRERDDLANQVTRLELEKRMAVMEADHAAKEMQEKAACLAEMQMEIDLVTKASLTANARAAQGEELIKSVKTDKQYVQQLEAHVQALQEWALASTEAKILAQERVRFLENQLRSLQSTQRGGVAGKESSDTSERILLVKSASLVVGAGDVGFRVVALDEEMIRSVKVSERVVLRWKFDLTQEDAFIVFSIFRAVCDSASKNGEYLLKERTVRGGAAGETDGAFAVQGACTLCWSNLQSWIRPKTVKYTIEAVVMSD